MRRREFITLLGGAAAAWPLAARAQQPNRIRRVAVLESDNGGPNQSHIAAFRQAIDKLGWHEGRNIQFEIRLAENNINRARGYAEELAAMMPDVFLATNVQMAQLLQNKTRSIPIVFIRVPDPVGSGLVANAASPAGNVTGFSNFDFSIGGKWLELLKEVKPNLKRVAVILLAGNPTQIEYLKMIEAAAGSFAVQLSSTAASDGPDIEAAINTFALKPDGGLIVAPSFLAIVHRDQIIKQSALKRLPAIYPYREFAAAGGLMSYGYDEVNLYQQAASYVARILKGEKPAELPVQYPTKFELVINLKTAKALGLEVSTQLQQRADEVIE
jgi:putative tryptophan/tyrosine transport system substrate-binding protein